MAIKKPTIASATIDLYIPGEAPPGSEIVSWESRFLYLTSQWVFLAHIFPA